MVQASNGKIVTVHNVRDSLIVPTPITGESEPASLLSGVTIEKKRYRIRCREMQMQNVATIKTDNTIMLISIEEIN